MDETPAGEPHTTQCDNIAGGDVVGRDKHVNAQSTHLHLPAPSSVGQLARLLERLTIEERQGNQAAGLIEELKRFCEPVEANPIGVEQKLLDGGRADLIEFALQAKEQFAKKLARNTFFESAQEIHALLLSKIYSVFWNEIIPQIRAGASRAIIDVLVRERIIDPIVGELQSTPFRYYDEHVHGMLYYLTGNCYVKWT